MSKWFRWYSGTTEDGKFRAIARNARVTVRDVIALWACILEDASSDKHRGVCVRDEEFLASVLDFSDGQVAAIIVAMQAHGMVENKGDKILVLNWGVRQFESDKTDGTNAERQKRWRNKSKTEPKRDRNGYRNGTVTATKRPDTDTDTDKIPRKNTSEVERQNFDEWYRLYPRREARGSAEKAYTTARKSTEASVLLDGAKKAVARYAGSDPQFIPLPATWLNQKRWLDDPPKPAGKPLTRVEELYRSGIV